MLQITVTDTELARAQDGGLDSESFAHLLEETRKGLIDHLQHLGTPHSRREDIAQEILLDIIRDFPSKRFSGGAQGYCRWVATVCAHNVFDDLKSRLALKRDERRKVTWSSSECAAVNVFVKGLRRPAYFDSDDIRQALLLKFGKESKIYQAVDLRLKGHSVEEVAELLGHVSDRAVKRYVHTAKEFLNARADHYWSR